MAPPPPPFDHDHMEVRLRRVEANVTLALAYVREIARIHLGVVRCQELENEHGDE